MKTHIVYSEEFAKHNNMSHPENAQRLSVMMEELKHAPFFHNLEIIEPEILPEKSLFNVHSEQMIEQIKEMSKKNESWIDFDTYVCQSDFKTARLAAGGLVMTCDNIMNKKAKNGFALIRPPGHHATKNRSMGFCLFNNAAIAADLITKQGKKVLIFDPDVHHGNGTQDIFYDRKDVLYQSIHLTPHYPGTGGVEELGMGDGLGYTVNAPLSYGYGDTAVKKLMDEIFLPISKQFKPDLIIVSTGFDSHYKDPLGGLKYSTNLYRDIIRELKKVQSKIACTLEGGYNLNWIGKCLVSQVGEMADNPVNFDEKVAEEKDVENLILKLKNRLDSFWKI